MRVESNASSQGSTQVGTTAKQSDMFMKLLLAQLRTQDPLSPMDANSFVNQMVQFNTLEQITEIRSLIENSVTLPGSGEQ
jgi:flagellar basal-body rod modification protein FlgD